MWPIIQINVMNSLIRALLVIYFFWIIVQIGARAPGGWRRWVCRCWPSSSRYPTPPLRTSPGQDLWPRYIASTELYMLVKIVVDFWKCFTYFDVTGEVFKNQPIHFLAQWGTQQLKQGWMLLNQGRGESERRIYSHLVKRNPKVACSTRWRDADVVQQGHGTGPSLTM